MRYTEAFHMELVEAVQEGRGLDLDVFKVSAVVNRVEELSALVNRHFLEAEAQFDIGVTAGREDTLKKLREQGYITAAQESRLKHPSNVPADVLDVLNMKGSN